MIKNLKNVVVVWFIGLVLVNVLLFCLERGLTATFWSTFVFIWGAFISVLIYQIIIERLAKTVDDRFFFTPALVVSAIYLIAQIPVSIVFSIGSTVIPFKVAFLVNALLLIISWSILLGAIAGNSYIYDVNSEQKNNHVEF